MIYWFVIAFFRSTQQSNEKSHEVTEDDVDIDVIVVHMDIREPLSTLRTLLQNKVGIDLTLYCFTLQESQHVILFYFMSIQCHKGWGVETLVENSLWLYVLIYFKLYL